MTTVTNGNGSGVVLTTNEATITTATITIKALTVNKRQVTQALFKQLQEESVIDPDTGELRGPVWGRVNYHPDGCKDDSAHIHVVWQKGNELRRAYVHDRPTGVGAWQEKRDALRKPFGWWVAACVVGGRPLNGVKVLGDGTVAHPEAKAWGTFPQTGEIGAEVPVSVRTLRDWRVKAPDPSGVGIVFYAEDTKSCPEPPAGEPAEVRAAWRQTERARLAHAAANKEHRDRYGSTWGQRPGEQASSERRERLWQEHHDAVMSYRDALLPGARRRKEEELRAGVWQWLGHAGDPLTEEAVTAEIAEDWALTQEALAALDRFCDTWHASYAAVAATDQLFIAV